MNRRLQRFLRLDGVGVCPHDDSARCSCRKPQPGLLLEAARVWNIDLESSFIVGDRWRDIEAGHRAGCRAIFVDYGYAEQRPDGPFVGVRSLREAAQWILRSHSPGHSYGDADNMPDVASFRVKIFADGADRASILDLAANPWIKGFTTNPTLMRKAGITDYEAFGRSLARAIPNRPFSFEVLSDDFDEMEQQALQIATWGDNVYVKIPITDTRGRSSAALVKRLARQGVKVNVTALMTLDQVDAVVPSLRDGPAELHFDFRRPHRRRRLRSAAHLVRRAGAHPRLSANRTDLGQPARAVQHRAGRCRSAATSSRSRTIC